MDFNKIRYNRVVGVEVEWSKLRGDWVVTMLKQLEVIVVGKI